MDVLILNDEANRLALRLTAAEGPARLPLLVEAAWHFRQRDTRRAVALADEALALCGTAALPARERERIDARLGLVRGEAKWLFAELDAADAHAQAALAVFSQLDDAVGCADAHWLLATIATDRGIPRQRDAEFAASAAAARRAGDALRTDLAEAALARWAVLRDLRAAEAQWGGRFDKNTAALHPALAVWVNDFLGMVAFQSSDFGRAASCRMHMHDNALLTGQIQRTIIAATNIGGCFANLNDFQTALEWMNRGLDMARPTGWPVCIGIGLMQTAETQRQLGRLASAHELLVEALDVLQPLVNSRTYAITLGYMGDMKLDRADYEAALCIFEQYELRVAALNEPSMLSTGKRGQAQALLNLDRPDKAMIAATAAIAIAVEHEETYNEIEALLVLAQIHSRHALPPPDNISAPNAALHYLDRALELAATIDGYIVPGNMYDAIAREYAGIGDYAQAYAMSMQAIAAREKTNSAEALNRAVAVQIRHQTDQARSEAAHHRQLAESEIRRAEALQHMTNTLERLSAIGQEITAHLNVTAIFETLNRHVHGLLDATHFSVFLLDHAGAALDCVFGVEDGKPLPALHVDLSHRSANIALCARERREIMIDQPMAGFNPNHIPGTLQSGSALFAPLQVGSRLLGVMSIQSPYAHAYAERERLIFRTLCAYGAIALDNASAYRQLEASLKALGEAQAQLVEKNRELKNAYDEQEQMSLTDPLTGLRNRRFLLQQIEKDAASVLRRKRKQQKSRVDTPQDDMVFFMIDVDHFKSVNDQYGHAAGDAVLVQMRERLQKAVRETDHIIRWGGEEFLIVARDTNRSEAELIAERIRSAVAAQAFELDHGVQLQRTCSVGFACFPFIPANPELLSWSQVAQLADQCLYIAKQSGRDAWVGLHDGDRLQPGGIFDRLIRNTEQTARNGEVRLVASRELYQPVARLA